MADLSALWIILGLHTLVIVVRVCVWLTHPDGRAMHNDRDYQCIHWWGDRSGSPDLMNERCTVCRTGGQHR